MEKKWPWTKKYIWYIHVYNFLIFSLVDLKKAYGIVTFGKLWTELEHNNINNNLTKAVKNLYKHNITKIKVGRNTDQSFRITKWFKQGCCMSPTLFNMYLRQTLKI